MKEQCLDATKARREFFRVLSEVRYGGRRIVINRRGRPQAIMIPLPEYHRLKQQDLFRSDSRSDADERNRTEPAKSESERAGKALARALAEEMGIEL